MKAKLISYTKFASASEKSLEHQIAYCARVSNPGNQNNDKTAKQLIKYLMAHNHWSPFEMVNVCLEITTTRDIARQMLRHRSFSFQEFSQRYAEPNFNFEQKETRFQYDKNRQNSIDISVEDLELDAEWKYRQRLVSDLAEDNYRWAREHNIAKEQARAVLPEGCTESVLYMNGTLRSWIHYIQLRTANGTQREHQAVAEACADEIAKVFPLIQEIKNDS
jgi:thymidylate synthase (FAD)